MPGASSFLIHISNVNKDNFIKRGYYRGHVDVYKSYGEYLFYYNVNSLYPYVMQKEPMPTGKPVWNIDMKNKDLDILYGFIEADKLDLRHGKCQAGILFPTFKNPKVTFGRCRDALVTKVPGVEWI
ncbi:hypothetical protein AgCh_015109 [Apium graveolens]